MPVLFRRALTGLVGLAVLALAAGEALAQQVPTPPPADRVVEDAVALARATNRTVLIEFGASWCQWCRSFEAFVTAPDTGPIVADNYVVINLVVHEHPDKVALEHPGGAALMNRWGGAQSGLPFYVFLDGHGAKIGDSNAMPGGGNIGFPAKPDEIAAFMRVIDKTAFHLTPETREAIQSYLVRVMPAEP
jgi:thiol:disulfide interchange protein